MANAHAKAYIDQNLEYKFCASKDAMDWLSERLGEQRKRSRRRGRAADTRRSTTPSPSRIAQNIVVQRLGDLNSAVTKAKTARIEKEAQ